MKTKIILTVITLSTILIVNNALSQSTTDWGELPSNLYKQEFKQLPSSEYKQEFRIGAEYVEFDNKVLNHRPVENNILRSNRPGVDDNEAVGGEMPVGNGLFIMLLFAIIFVLKKWICFNSNDKKP